MALLDTHLTIKKFMQFGFSEDQAEVITEAINEQNNNLVTKKDIELLENKLNFSLKEVSTELAFSIKGVENKLVSKINDLENNLKTEIQAINTNIKWLMAIVLVILGILLKNTF